MAQKVPEGTERGKTPALYPVSYCIGSVDVEGRYRVEFIGTNEAVEKKPL